MTNKKRELTKDELESGVGEIIEIPVTPEEADETQFKGFEEGEVK